MSLIVQIGEAKELANDFSGFPELHQINVRRRQEKGKSKNVALMSQ